MIIAVENLMDELMSAFDMKAGRPQFAGGSGFQSFGRWLTTELREVAIQIWAQSALEPMFERTGGMKNTQARIVLS